MSPTPTQTILHPEEDFGADFHEPQNRKRERTLLTVLIIINLTGMFVEIVGGILTNSLALLSDAGHMFTHLFSLLVAYLAILISERGKSKMMTFGYFRMEILAAFFNGVSIFVIVVLILVEAIQRIISNESILVREMVFVAIFGLVVNLVGAYLLTGVAKKDINLKAVLVHLLSDTFSSVAILLGAMIIHYTQWYFVDAVASLVIAVVIGFWGYGLLRTSIKILLQGVPEGMDPQQVVHAICEVDGVKEVHDVHIWELTSHKYVMTGHILTDDISISKSNEILKQINRMVKERFQIGHTTFQFEIKN